MAHCSSTALPRSWDWELQAGQASSWISDLGHSWRRKTKNIAVGFDFMYWFLFLLNDSHGWQRLQRYSLGTWSHCRFCILSVSVLHLINKKHFSGGVNLGCKWESTKCLHSDLTCLGQLTLLIWLPAPLPSPSQPLRSSEGCCNWDVNAHALHSADRWCPGLCHRDLPLGSWLPTQGWVHPSLDTVVAFWIQMCDGN